MIGKGLISFSSFSFVFAGICSRSAQTAGQLQILFLLHYVLVELGETSPVITFTGPDDGHHVRLMLRHIIACSHLVNTLLSK